MGGVQGNTEIDHSGVDKIILVLLQGPVSVNNINARVGVTLK